MPLRLQLLVLQLVIVLVAIATVGVVALRMQSAHIRDSYEERMIGVARSVSTLPSVVEAFDDADPAAVIQPIAELIREGTGVTYVVVTDTAGIRYSHPNPDRIGEMVSTDPSEPLAGRTYVGTQTGTLGESWRVKTPLTRDGEIVGTVSVGTLESTLRADLDEDLPQLLGWLLGAALVGTAGAFSVSRLVWRRIYRMEPEEIASLREVRDAMLHSLGEGMLAVDEHQRVALVNSEAARLLGLEDDVVGRPVEDVLDAALLAVLGRAGDDGDQLVLVGERILYARADRATVDGRQVGTVLILRDRTEVQALVRDLDGARDLTQALRAQAHEFANRMHVVSGLIELGLPEDALAFIARVGGSAAQGGHGTAHGVHDPDVAALVLAKTATAHERGVQVMLDPASVIEPDGTTDAVTVLGNLIDNATDAAGPGGTVQVHLWRDGRCTVLRVSDDGPGVPAEDRARIFDAGFSTKVPRGRSTRGIGLALVQQVVHRRGGEVAVVDAPGGGATFRATLPLQRITATSVGAPMVPAPERLA